MAGVKTERAGMQSVVDTLMTCLADTYVLYVKTQNFHWNIVDPRFAMLHKLFEEQYEELAEASDAIAEQIRKLGEIAPASMRQFLEMSTLEEASGELSGDQMLKQLMSDHDNLARSLSEWIDHASNKGDQATADLYVNRLHAHQKAAWMLRSHLRP
jgi:starvation-inducible DNA-binding protein